MVFKPGYEATIIVTSSLCDGSSARSSLNELEKARELEKAGCDAAEAMWNAETGYKQGELSLPVGAGQSAICALGILLRARTKRCSARVPASSGFTVTVQECPRAISRL